MRRNLALLASPAGMRRALAFRPDPSDIFISPYAKCGTTWMQQIVHGLRSGGAMDFDEISQVVPWLELAHDMGIDPEAPQVASPRAFKSHLSWHDIPKGARYIVVFREPVAAMLSLYRFFEGWQFEPGSICREAFATYYLARDRHDYWTHAASWWGQRENAAVLLLSYEGMRRDLPGTVARVADFIGISDPHARAVALAQAELTFMKRHERQFDDHLLREARDAACGLPPGGRASKVSEGSHLSTEVDPAVHARFAQRWHKEMGARFGLADYAAMELALKGE